MRRKFLEDLGLDKETIDKIIDQNSQDIGGYKKKIEELEAANTQLKEDVKTRDTQLDDLKKAGSVDDLKKQLEEAQEANTKAKQEYDAKIADMKYDAAIENALSEAKYFELMKGQIDRSKLKLNEDDTVSGLDDQVKELKKNYADQFEPSKRGKEPNTKGGNPDKKPEEMTYEDFVNQLENE